MHKTNKITIAVGSLIIIAGFYLNYYFLTTPIHTTGRGKGAFILPVFVILAGGGFIINEFDSNSEKFKSIKTLMIILVIMSAILSLIYVFFSLDLQ